MAIGLGLMMGFRFVENFNQPYISHSITEFWRRWHMSLPSCLRVYLYISLVGNRGGPAKTYHNPFLSMLLGGDRTSVVSGKRVSVCVDLGGSQVVKTQKTMTQPS